MFFFQFSIVFTSLLYNELFFSFHFEFLKSLRKIMYDSNAVFYRFELLICVSNELSYAKLQVLFNDITN